MNIDNMNKTMPFIENEGYVASIVSQATENAIRNPQSKRRLIPFARIAASVAVVATIACSGWIFMKNRTVNETPLDTFLSSITDEEASMLDYYYVEDLYIDSY